MSFGAIQSPTVAVASARNVSPPDGVHALVTVAGVPGGALALLLSETPDIASATPAAFVPTGNLNEYRVRVDHAGTWYFFAVDASQVGIAPAPPVALAVGLVDDVDLNLAGIYLASLLDANRAALEASLSSGWLGEPSSTPTLKHITYGTAAAIQGFPAILVSKPRETAEYVAMPYIREHRYTLEVFTFIYHNDSYSHLPLAVKLAGRVMEILNLPQNDEIVLPSGTRLAFCQASSGEADDSEIGDGAWAAVGSVVWSGTCLKQAGMIGV